jgi:hypothetical protein
MEAAEFAMPACFLRPIQSHAITLRLTIDRQPSQRLTFVPHCAPLARVPMLDVIAQAH